MSSSDKRATAGAPGRPRRGSDRARAPALQRERWTIGHDARGARVLAAGGLRHRRGASSSRFDAGAGGV